MAQDLHSELFGPDIAFCAPHPMGLRGDCRWWACLKSGLRNLQVRLIGLKSISADPDTLQTWKLHGKSSRQRCQLESKASSRQLRLCFQPKTRLKMLPQAASAFCFHPTPCPVTCSCQTKASSGFPVGNCILPISGQLQGSHFLSWFSEADLRVKKWVWR